MNTYYKYYPNVFLAKCTEKHIKGDFVIVNTKYGKENECEIFNLIFEKDEFYFYSIIRTDGTNSQTRAISKANKYQSWSDSANKKSLYYYEASQEGREFLSLGEPIKIGHHSEKRHRALIERNWNRMGKSVKFSEKAEEHESKSDYWEKRADEINLSMPESLIFFTNQLEKAKSNHEGMKKGTIKRSHSMSLQYAKKEVNEIKKKLDIAIKLWS